MEDRCDELSVLSADPASINAVVLEGDRRVLLWGAMGVGKSTLAAGIAQDLAARGRQCWCVGADPGSPAFGIPGAVSVGRWSANGWQLVGMEALCTLDAGRFRLPLVSAIRQVCGELSPGVMLVDGPGVVRGVAGAELLPGLVDATGADLVLMLSREGKPLLHAELGALPVDVYIVSAAVEACRPGRRVRGHRRTALWDAYLAPAVERELDLSRVRLLGTPPPIEVPSAWTGRQLALQAAGRTIAMGEVLSLEADRLHVRLPDVRVDPEVILVRDAVRSSTGVLESAKPFVTEPFVYLPPRDVAPVDAANAGPRVIGRVGAIDICLMNGVFGDPLLHLRLRFQRRSLLFDLGEGLRLPARIVHQVTDVFITHAHMDHIGGFLWLLRSRIGEFPPCRLYGPPGLAEHIDGMIRGILWDRMAAELAPSFEVTEVHGRRLLRYRVEVQHPGWALVDECEAPDGVLYRESAFQIRAAVLDHGGTPVLAFAFEPARQLNVRKDRLAARGLAPGPWLGKLKQCLLAEDKTAEIILPDGQVVAAGPLGNELVLITPGKKLVYATDFADTAENRHRLQQLAHGAHTFFCEATFIEPHADQARRTGHLTTRACGEIATAAGVARLVPFHFSRRYEHHPEQVYDEITAVCARVMVPKIPV